MNAHSDFRQLYPYVRSPDQDRIAHHPVVIVGAGPVGLALALDLGTRGVPVLILDDAEGIGEGSRAICFAKRTLEICDRLGAARPMMAKGVVWNRGRVFRDDREIYAFDLQPEADHRHPAFINLQQPYFEKYLHDAIGSSGAPVAIRGRNRVTAVDNGDVVTVDIDTPDGPYRLTTDWLVACDGARSPVRGMLGLGFDGRVFQDNFLIADVAMQADFPTERWFWFAPHFKSGDSALLHKQPDGVWRIDFQLGWDIDRAAELDPARVRARVDAMLGPGVAYDLVWTSIYTFQCRRMDRFRHGRVLFAGDAAHQVSPFGARGANSGVQDADNLGWKLAAVVGGASDQLLDSYDQERVQAADENILNSTRATDFITPKSPVSRMFRDAVLDLAEHAPFARALVNSGRLSLPTVHDGSALNGPDHDALPARTRPGAPAVDAPVGEGWLLQHLGRGFVAVGINVDAPEVGLPTLRVEAVQGSALAARYLGDAAQAVYLVRPDQHVAARWTICDGPALTAAHARAMGG
jgi:3-(3-hydroxy-phenyl)propionate hydroxylase